MREGGQDIVDMMFGKCPAGWEERFRGKSPLQIQRYFLRTTYKNRSLWDSREEASLFINMAKFDEADARRQAKKHKIAMA